jgi:hypothetical protein
MKKLSILFIFTILQITVYAQPSIQWQKCLGGTSNDYVGSIQQTADGGYIIVGITNSNDGDVSGNHGGYSDVWVVKLNGTGNLQWQKCLGGTNYDKGFSIQQTSDGGYIMAGSTDSNDGDVSGNHGGGDDVWVAKLDGVGTLQWQKCLGGTSYEVAKSIQQTTDGGYILTGYTNSNDGDVSGNHGYMDVWVVKLDGVGTLQWQKCLGGTVNDDGFSIQQTMDGGYILTGGSSSNDGDLIGNHGLGDFWVVKLDGTGILQWQKCLGGTDFDNGYCIKQTIDGGYILTGLTRSIDGDVSGNHGSDDTWVVKLDGFGNLQWQKCLGGTNYEYAYSIQQTIDGGFILLGTSTSNDGDVSGWYGQEDFWVLKLDGAGNLQWQKCLGGAGIDGGFSIQQTSDNGYILTGRTSSNDGDVSGNHGGSGALPTDVWVVKLSSAVGMNELSSITSLYVFPNPTKDELNIQVENTVIGSIYQLTDITGRPIARGIITEEKSRISLQGLSSGTYLLSIGDEMRKTLKVIKE